MNGRQRKARSKLKWKNTIDERFKISNLFKDTALNRERGKNFKNHFFELEEIHFFVENPKEDEKYFLGYYQDE